MNELVPAAACIAFLAWVSFSAPVFAADTAAPAPRESAPSVQDQIQALAEGQRRILQEIEEIKSLLQGNSAGRIETPAKPAPPSVISMNVRGEPFRGDARARVAIMEYSDFDCSFCATYATEVFPKIDENYIKPGRIKYFFRDLPAREHTNAMTKARAARCAGDQGKFWEMHDRLFVSQSAPDNADMIAQARALGLDTEAFGACLASGKYEENIRRAVAGAVRNGVYGTPAFLIGTVTEDGNFFRSTKVLVGGESYEAIRAVVEEVLSSAAPK